MLHDMFAIYDSKAKIYNTPFALLNEDVARRAALDLLADTTTQVSNHPQDFTMFYLGTYDDEQALFDLTDTPINVFRFHELVKDVRHIVENEAPVKLAEQQ